MLARAVGFTPALVRAMPPYARLRLEAFGAAAMFSVMLTFFGLGELFRATLGAAFGLLAGLFLAALHFFVLRIVVAGGGMSLSLGRSEAARWRAGKGTLILLGLLGSLGAQGFVVMALEAPLGASVAAHRDALLEVRRQSVAARFDALEEALADEREAFARSAKKSEVHATYTDDEREAIEGDLAAKAVALADRRRIAERDVRLYREHLWTREFEGRRIAEAWRSHTTIAAAVTLALAALTALPGLLRLFFRSAFASYYARRWEADRRLVLAHHAWTKAHVAASIAASLRRIRADAQPPRLGASPYADPAFASVVRAGHGLLDGRVIDTLHATEDRGHPRA